MSGPPGTDPLSMLTAYQHSAVIGTAVETGLADLLAAAPHDADQAAAKLGTEPRATAYLLEAMCALGLASRRDDGFELSEAGAQLAGDAEDSIAEIVRKEWFFYRAWADLPESVRTGHAQIPPWRDRLQSDRPQSLSFLRALDDLAARFGGGLAELAALERPGRLLDVGGGAGSHAANLAAATPGIEATVLDLPPVEELVAELHPELGFVAGDLGAPRFGRPEGEAWDYVLLANILHDHPPPRCREIVTEAAALLGPEGILLIYEWVPDGGPQPALALFSLMMVVENEGGGTWSEREIAGWLGDAGLAPEPVRRDGGPIAVVRARRAA